MDTKSYLKSLLALSQMTYITLAEKLSKETNKKYTEGSLKAKIYRETISYKEMKKILKILGYHIEIQKDKD